MNHYSSNNLWSVFDCSAGCQSSSEQHQSFPLSQRAVTQLQPVSLSWHRVRSTVPGCHFKPWSLCLLHSCILPLGQIIALGSLSVPNLVFTKPESINFTCDYTVYSFQKKCVSSSSESKPISCQESGTRTGRNPTKCAVYFKVGYVLHQTCKDLAVQ